MKTHLHLNKKSTQCDTCMLGNLCIPEALSGQDILKFPELIKERIRIPKGEFLYQKGDQVEAVYSIRFGSIKTFIKSENYQQITGFFMPSELVGLDSLGEEVHISYAVALEDTEVCMMKISDLEQIAKELPKLHSHFRKLLSKEIVRSHQVILSMGSLRSDQRVASFLLNISHRMKNLGYSSTQFRLRMSREDMGNYLGLTLETVSRILSRFSKEELISIQNKEVELLDMPKLKNLLHNHNT